MHNLFNSISIYTEYTVIGARCLCKTLYTIHVSMKVCQVLDSICYGNQIDYKLMLNSAM